MKSPLGQEDSELERINGITERIIGCAIEVHRVLRAGLYEAVYRSALATEFDATRLAYKREVRLPALYKGRQVGNYRIDFVVEDQVVVEIKASSGCIPYSNPKVLLTSESPRSESVC